MSPNYFGIFSTLRLSDSLPTSISILQTFKKVITQVGSFLKQSKKKKKYKKTALFASAVPSSSRALPRAATWKL